MKPVRLTCLPLPDQTEYEELAKAHKEYQSKASELEAQVQDLQEGAAAVRACKLTKIRLLTSIPL